MKEDVQPNEALEKAKANHFVPAIRVSRPPKRYPVNKQPRHEGLAQKSQRLRSAHSYPNIDSHDRPCKPQRSQDVSVRRSDCRNASLRHVETRNPAIPNNPAVYPFPAQFSRELHDYERFNDESAWSRQPGSRRQTFVNGPTGSRPPGKMKRRNTRDNDEMVVDLPPMCRKGMYEESNCQAVFFEELRKQLKRTVNLEIIHHRFTDTQLIFTYREPEVAQASVSEEASVVGPTGKATHSTGASSCSFMSMPEVNSVSSIASGSNVKLEDICDSSSLLHRNGKHGSSSVASPLDQSGELHGPYRNFVAPRQISSKPRPFRSGTVTLQYTSGCSPQEADIFCPDDDMPEPEVIVIDDTLPLSPKHKGMRDATNVAVLYDETSEQVAIGSTERAGDDLSDLVEQDGVRLREETRAITEVPRANGDKMRRVLTRGTSDFGYCITMHGFVNEVSMESVSHIRPIYMPSDEEKRFVEDACLLSPPFDNLMLVAQANEETALSLLHLKDESDHRMIRIPRTSSDRERLRRGVSAVTTLPNLGSSLSFVSAGYDHIVHTWSLDPTTISEQPPVPEVLGIRHSSLVQSLLSVGHRLISGAADNSIRIWDLQASHMLSTIRTSNSVYQLHRTNHPDIVLTEVAHRDSQFELQDFRLAPHGRPPLRFGYHSTQGIHGRYVRGAVEPHAWSIFVSGGRDGFLRLWDLRNVTRCQQVVLCQPGQKIVHAAFAENALIAGSEDNRLSFFDLKQI